MNERIETFVLGGLTPEERAAMMEARRFDPALDRAVDDAEARMAPLALGAGEETPSEGLWGRIEAALDEEQRALSHRSIHAFADGEWEAVVPGIDSKPLWNARTSLLRCAPGSVLPSHLHDDEEHLVVLAGDLIIGGRTFLPGDHIRSPRGEDNFCHMTRTGCLIFSQIGS